jgi:hypothetical protein
MCLGNQHVEGQNGGRAMSRTIVSSALFAIFLMSDAAGEDFAVNKSQWDALSAEDQRAITTILQDSKLMRDVKIVTSPTGADLPPSPLSDLKDVPPNSADWIKKWGGIIKKNICGLSCEAGGVGATSACGALSGGAAAAVCGSVVTAAMPACKKLC